jgi:hypothetical protein
LRGRSLFAFWGEAIVIFGVEGAIAVFLWRGDRDVWVDGAIVGVWIGNQLSSLSPKAIAENDHLNFRYCRFE